MTQDNLLFGNEETIDTNKNYLAELVGDDKKFKSVEDLAKSKVHADLTIDNYKRRMDELRADYLLLREENTKKANLEELIDKLEAQRLASSANTQANEVTQKPAQLDLKEVETLLERKLQEAETSKKTRDNSAQVVSKLQEAYGSDYQNKLKQRIQELDLTPEYASELAARSPKAFFQTFGLDQKQETYTTFPKSTQRSDNFTPTSGPKRTWAYYQELWKKSPELRFDKKLATQMDKDAFDLGEAFRDGDYYVKGLHEQ